MAKTDVKVTLYEDSTVKDIITTVVKALRRASKDKESVAFQAEVVSGHKLLMDVVKEYVTLTE